MYSLPDNYKKLTYNQKMDLVDTLIDNYRLNSEDIWEEIYKKEHFKSKLQIADYLLEEIEKKINANERLLLEKLKDRQSKEINNKEYSVVIIIIGLSLTFLFVYLLKKTTFFVEPVAIWKYFLMIPICFVFCGISLQVSMGMFIEYHLKKLGISENKLEVISLIIWFLFYGGFYFLITN